MFQQPLSPRNINYWIVRGFFVSVSNIKFNSISKLGDVFLSCYCQDVVAEGSLPTFLDADAQRLLVLT